jgi:hypothetical protein
MLGEFFDAVDDDDELVYITLAAQMNETIH